MTSLFLFSLFVFFNSHQNTWRFLSAVINLKISHCLFLLMLHPVILTFVDRRNWTAALKDFTSIIEQDPEDSRAYTYRARVHAKMVRTVKTAQ